MGSAAEGKSLAHVYGEDAGSERPASTAHLSICPSMSETAQHLINQLDRVRDHCWV